MGNKNSKNNSKEIEIEAMKNKIDNLENLINTYESRVEILVNNKFSSMIKNDKPKNVAELIEAQEKIKELQQYNAELLLENDRLRNPKKSPIDSAAVIDILKEKDSYDIHKISDEKIAELVEEFLKNEGINIKYFPDWVERKLYKNIFTIFLNLIKEILEDTNVKFLGHQLTFKVTPEDN